MKIVKGLTKVNAAKYGIELAPEHDFTDDGNRFRGFSYKGLIMTQCRADGECYLAIRVDYQRNNFTWKEWSETEEYGLCDEFNGVSEFDIEKLVENLERIIAKVNEMNENATVSEAELEEVKSILNQEISGIENFLEDVKRRPFEWWNAKSYYIKSIADYMQNLTSKIEYGRKAIANLSTMDMGQQKQWIESARRSINDVNYTLLNGKWYMNQIDEYMKKSVE